MTMAPTTTTERRSAKGAHLLLTVLLSLFGFSLLVCVFFGVALYSTQGSLHRSRPYNMALAQAGQSPCVSERMGSPLKPGRFVMGSVSKTSTDGYSDLEIPLRGPLAKGRMHVIARETDNAWTIEYLSVRTGDDRLLLVPASPPCQ